MFWTIVAYKKKQSTRFRKANRQVDHWSRYRTYNTNLDAMINDFQIIIAPLPRLVVAVATLGRGIQFCVASEMKLK
ncbi:MAG: hypothetical protein QM762_11410 [Chryseolinea sp.]